MFGEPVVVSRLDVWHEYHFSLMGLFAVMRWHLVRVCAGGSLTSDIPGPCFWSLEFVVACIAVLFQGSGALDLVRCFPSTLESFFSSVVHETRLG